MSSLRIPSLQHLARNWHADSKRIQKELVAVVMHPPTFSYSPLYSAVWDMLVLRVPYEQITEGIKLKVKRERDRDILIAVLPLIRDHIEGLSPDFVQRVARRYYPVARGLMIPFEPPLVYGLSGQFYFPWFSFWRSNPLANERLSLFVTLVDEVLMQDPDLEYARFEILDFSADNSRAPRKLRIINSSEIPRVSEERKIQMLEIFAEGYSNAQQQLAEIKKPSKKNNESSAEFINSQPDLFS